MVQSIGMIVKHAFKKEEIAAVSALAGDAVTRLRASDFLFEYLEKYLWAD